MEKRLLNILYLLTLEIGQQKLRRSSIPICGPCGMVISSVGGMEATFLRSGIAIGKGLTPVMVGVDVGICIVSE